MAAAHMLRSAAAGSFATFVGDLTMFPIDTVKTMQQAQGPEAALGMLGTIRSIIGTGGLGAFYSGWQIYCLTDGVAGFFKFGTYELLKKWCAASLPAKLQAVAFYVCGGFAFLASSVALVPGELVKQRLQTGMYSGMWSGLRSLLAAEGVRGLYTGWGAVCLRDVPFTMIELGIYDNLKLVLVRRRLARQRLLVGASRGAEKRGAGWSVQASPTMLESWVAAAVSGAVAGWLTNPLDLVKTRLMTGLPGVSPLQCARQIVGQGGFGALFQGATARVCWLVPFTAIYLAIYEFIKPDAGEETMQPDRTESQQPGSAAAAGVAGADGLALAPSCPGGMLPEVLAAELKVCFDCVASSSPGAHRPGGLVGHRELSEILSVGYGLGWTAEMNQLWQDMVMRSPPSRQTTHTGTPLCEAVPLSSAVGDAAAAVGGVVGSKLDHRLINFDEFVELMLPFSNEMGRPAVVSLFFQHHCTAPDVPWPDGPAGPPGGGVVDAAELPSLLAKLFRDVVRSVMHTHTDGAAQIDSCV